MDLKNFSSLLAMSPPPTPPGTQPNPTGSLLQMLLLFAMFGVVFYLMLIRPQQKRNRQQAEMLKSVKPGDKIMTSGGVIATVVSVKDKSLTIRSADSKMEITKSAMVEIVERSGESSES